MRKLKEITFAVAIVLTVFSSFVYIASAVTLS
jgi:preprotein translocase subunit SecE